MKGKKILITGGGGRLGSAIGKECLMQGAEVILIDNNESALNRVANECRQLSLDNCLQTYKGNGCSEEGIINIVKHVKDRMGNIDGFVHGAYPRSRTWGCKLENLEEINLIEDLSKQLGGAIMISKYVINELLKHEGGSLVHISSIQGVRAPKFEHYVGTDMNSPIEYSAIKAGVIAITKWLAKYYGRKGVRVNCISPGGIEDGQPEIFVERYRKSCSNIGLLRSEHITKTAALLLSEDGIGINGQNFIIDDGWTL